MNEFWLGEIKYHIFVCESPMIDNQLQTMEAIKNKGKSHETLLLCEPSLRSRDDLTFHGALEFISLNRTVNSYEIAANLPLAFKICPHCHSGKVSLHGRYVIRLADLPFVDATGRSMPIQYAITAQRYQCMECNRGTVEPLPDALKPVITHARITKRLSEWLFYAILSGKDYETLARMTGYSKVWVRKWYQDVRIRFNLPPKSSKPGPRVKIPDAR